MYVYQPMNLNSDLATLYKTRSRYPGVKVFQEHIGTKAMYACTCICNIYAYECVCVNLNLIAWLEFVVVVLVAKSCLTLCESTDRSLPESSVHEISQARILDGLPFPSPRDLPNSGLEPEPPELQVISLMLSHKGGPWLEVNLNQKPLALVTCVWPHKLTMNQWIVS